MASVQSTTPAGNPIAAASLVAASLTWFAFRSLGVWQGAHSFTTPIGDFSMTGDAAQIFAAVGAFLGPQLIASLGNIPILGQLTAFLSVPDTLTQINSKIDAVVQATKKS